MNAIQADTICVHLRFRVFLFVAITNRKVRKHTGRGNPTTSRDRHHTHRRRTNHVHTFHHTSRPRTHDHRTSHARNRHASRNRGRPTHSDRHQHGRHFHETLRHPGILRPLQTRARKRVR